MLNREEAENRQGSRMRQSGNSRRETESPRHESMPGGLLGQAVADPTPNGVATGKLMSRRSFLVKAGASTFMEQLNRASVQISILSPVCFHMQDGYLYSINVRYAETDIPAKKYSLHFQTVDSYAGTAHPRKKTTVFHPDTFLHFH